MKFNRRARLDTRQVRDLRGRRASGGGGASGGLPGGLPVTGGIGGLIVVVIIVLAMNYLGGDGDEAVPNDTNLAAECTTGEQANEDPDCARVAIVNSIQSFWSDALPDQTGTEYDQSQTTFFSGQVNTDCGPADSAVGPFYCPVDDYVYIDLTFFEDMLEGQLGARGGDFAEAYVLAHEYGHHVQDLLGTMGRVRTQQGPTSDSVRLELQADCFAGMWAAAATTAEDAGGEPFITDVTQEDMVEAIDAAHAVGDDRIQQRSGGDVDVEQWTHGSAAQRERWFMSGYQQRTVTACDTFATDDL